ncbi:MAG: type II toxin-antitoxin system VapB family antitoxin [Deltaproteobacteria bacterium]|nr:MAG: type II toxin-antitoxin system VapB family antitoxin [Deltaproteobacteria bacterium]
MATNLDIDRGLLEKALRLGGKKTKKAVVIEALEEYVRRLEQLKIIDLFGNVDFDPAYDYKKQRRRE